MSWDLATTEAVGLGVVLAAFAVLIVRLRRRRSDWRAEAEVALADCVSLIDLLKALQQHRGLSTGWLAGDRQFETRMQARRRNIDAMMSVVVRAAEHESGQLRPCFMVQEANLFRHRWRELIDRLPNSTPEQNIAAHTQQIEVLTGMIASLGEARLELPAVGSLPTGVIRNFAYRLPALAECLGQARALGSAAAAAGRCSPVARVRLMFLANRAERLLRQAADAERECASVRTACHQVDRLAQTLRTAILGDRLTTIAADTFFAIATDAIDQVFEWIRVDGDALSHMLESRDCETPVSASRLGSI